MANLEVFQTNADNSCNSTGIKTTAYFLISDCKSTSFSASHCKWMAVKNIILDTNWVTRTINIGSERPQNLP